MIKLWLENHGVFLKKTRLFITNLGDIKMKLTTQRLKKLIKEELQAAMEEGMYGDQPNLDQAVQGILQDCEKVMNGGKVRGIKYLGKECVVEVDVWLYQNGLIDDLYSAVDNPFVDQVMNAAEEKGKSAGMPIFTTLYMMGDG